MRGRGRAKRPCVAGQPDVTLKRFRLASPNTLASPSRPWPHARTRRSPTGPQTARHSRVAADIRAQGNPRRRYWQRARALVSTRFGPEEVAVLPQCSHFWRPYWATNAAGSAHGRNSRPSISKKTYARPDTVRTTEANGSRGKSD